jgi:hypothetical protein
VPCRSCTACMYDIWCDKDKGKQSLACAHACPCMACATSHICSHCITHCSWRIMPAIRPNYAMSVASQVKPGMQWAYVRRSDSHLYGILPTLMQSAATQWAMSVHAAVSAFLSLCILLFSLSCHHTHMLAQYLLFNFYCPTVFTEYRVVSTLFYNMCPYARLLFLLCSVLDLKLQYQGTPQAAALCPGRAYDFEVCVHMHCEKKGTGLAV